MTKPPFHAAVFALLAAIVTTVPVARATASQDDATYRALGLEPKPLTLESLGIAFHPPVGTKVTVVDAPGGVAVELLDDADPPMWSMRIQPLTTRDTLTPEARIQGLLQELSAGNTSPIVLVNRATSYGGRPGRMAYVEQKIGDLPRVYGWLFMAAEDGSTLVFAIQLDPVDLEHRRVLIDTSLSSLKITSAADVAQHRRRRLDMGAAFLATLRPERLNTLLNREQWYRYYFPRGAVDNDDDIELGYVLINFREGMLGEIDPSQPEDAFDASELEMGVLVEVTGHYLERARKSVFDSQGFYWLAWDRSHEAWSVRGTRRQGERYDSDAITGIRTASNVADPTGTINVITSGRRGATRDQKQWNTPDVYMPQAVRWGIGALLPREGSLPVVMRSYCVDHAAKQASLSLREDRWEPLEDGRWRLSSRARVSGEDTVSLYNADGRLIRQTLPTGAVMEPMPKNRLLSIWRDKGLE